MESEDEKIGRKETLPGGAGEESGGGGKIFLT